MVYITRKERFSAAHRLARPDWPEEKNRLIFGKCSNPNWHGHNYSLWMTVKGEPDPETGFVANLAEISRLIKVHILDKVDHKNLDMDVDFMKGRRSTTEMLAVAIWEVLQEPLKASGCVLHRIKVRETEKNSVEYFGN